MLKQLLNDEAGFIVSAELVMIATILVIGLVVGLSEVAHAVNEELNDVGEAIGCLNQSYGYTGFTKVKDDGQGGVFGNFAAVSFGCVFVDGFTVRETSDVHFLVNFITTPVMAVAQPGEVKACDASHVRNMNMNKEVVHIALAM